MYNSVYVDMDVLLDTRLGTVMKLHGAQVVNAILESGYHDRKDDNFPGVNVEAFKALYAARDLEIVALSAMTNIVSLLQEIIPKLIQQAMKRPFHNGVRIVVNTHPYQLSKDDTAEIVAIVAYHLRNFTELEIPVRFESVTLTDAELTPQYCMSNFSTMLMYDVNNWLSAQQHALLTNPIPKVTFIAPALFTVHTPTDEEFEELRKQLDWGPTPFHYMEKAVKPTINLKLMSPGLFSVVKPT